MERINQWLLEAWTAVCGLLSIANLHLLLLVGSGVLAIALLVLALTRWGHSRPVWKCVILSFIAHILLMGYGYATYLVLDRPVARVTVAEPMQVNLIEESELGTETGQADPNDPTELATDETSGTTWDHLADPASAAPEADSLEPLERPLIDSELVVESVEPPLLPKSIEDITPTPIAKPLAPAFVGTGVKDVSPDFAKPTPRDTNEFRPPDTTAIEAQAIEIARRGSQTDRQRDEMPDFVDGGDEEPLPRESIEPTSASDPDEDLLASLTEAMKRSGEQPPAMKPITKRARFAGAEPFDAQLSATSASIDFARQAKVGQRAGGLQVVMRRRLGDGQALPEIYSLRSSKNRLEAARQRGGSVLTERAVNAALGWLVTQQQTDGRWSGRESGAGRETKTFGHDRDGAGVNADPGITALATLSLLAGGHSHFEGAYQQNVQRALEYLISEQSNDGNLAGDAKLFARMYCHTMSLLAISEALAMTGDQRLMPAVQRGVDYCVGAQNRNDGGWRYQPGDGGDMSQFGWMVMALRSAKLGGAVVPADTFQRMRGFLRRCSSGVGNSLASYRPGQGASTSMTAEALFCRYLLDEVPASEGLRMASRRISQERPSPNRVNLYYWYYGTLAMRHVGGDGWDQWNSRLKATLVSLQETSGSDAGSFSPDGVWGGYGGRVYATAMAALNLEVYYRYLPAHEFTQTEPPTARTGQKAESDDAAKDEVIQLR